MFLKCVEETIEYYEYTYTLWRIKYEYSFEFFFPSSKPGSYLVLSLKRYLQKKKGRLVRYFTQVFHENRHVTSIFGFSPVFHDRVARIKICGMTHRFVRLLCNDGDIFLLLVNVSD